MSEGRKTQVMLLDDRRLEILIQVIIILFWISIQLILFASFAFSTVIIKMGILVKQNGESQMFDSILDQFAAQTDFGAS